jgi:energy-coupling factor transporter ATP-binding protein EcfA2
MTHLRITNVGPLREVDLEIKRFNFFIGQQSSGKSTIAKIISYCFWMEKEILTHPNKHGDLTEFENTFLQQLQDFHYLHGYLNDNSFIDYQTDYIHIQVKTLKCVIALTGKQTYKREKILYIPAERSIAVRNISQTKRDNLRSFAIDFNSAANYYDQNHKIPLLNLGIDYYQQVESNGKVVNKISINKKEDISLEDGSSGLQSVVPVAIAVDFFAKYYYRKGIEDKVLDVPQVGDRREVKNYIMANQKWNDKTKENTIDRLLRSHRTSFVVEEPEQNLYPTTQIDLLNSLITLCNGIRKHRLIITTHSPYIINLLNLLIKAKEKGKTINGAALEFDDLNAYVVENGIINDLKVQNSGIKLIDTSLLSEDINAIYNQYEEL